MKEKKVSNLIFTFIPFTYLIAYTGALSLRWHQWQLLTRTLPQFTEGLGTLFAIVTSLATLISIFIGIELHKTNKLAERILAGDKPTDADRALAVKVYNRVRFWLAIENVVGFFLGNGAIAILDISLGVTTYIPSRLFLIIVEAVCMGTIVTFYEVYLFDTKFKPFREILEIHSIGNNKTTHISSKILLVTFVCFTFMGVNAFTCGYGLLHGDNINPGLDVMKEYLLNGLIMILMNLAEYMGLMFIVCNEMKMRISDVTTVVKELEESGDLSRRINISIMDDIGLLTHTQNAFMDKLTGTIVNLKNETNRVTSSAEVLNQASGKCMSAVETMNVAIQEIDAEDQKTNQIINKTYTDIESLKESAQQVEQLILNQNHAMERSSASVEQLSGNIASIADTTKKADGVSEELRKTTDLGVKCIVSAEEAIELIKDSSHSVQEAVMMIQDISSQTNLLAMNASIEAAHAGEAGKGFAVVADEVRKLANTTDQNIQTVTQYITDMEEKIQAGVSAMSQAKNAFNSIDKGVEQTAEIVRRIAEAVEEQRIGTRETLAASQEVVNSIHSIQELAVSQRQHTDNVYENTKNIVESSNNITKSLKQTSDASRNLNTILSSVNECVAENDTAVQSMQSVIREFKTE
jgi:methyl-accepting chemotaxis protein